jgi:hypothetical protein
MGAGIVESDRSLELAVVEAVLGEPFGRERFGSCPFAGFRNICRRFGSETVP